MKRERGEGTYRSSLLIKIAQGTYKLIAMY
jgi:hypothetical protein